MASNSRAKVRFFLNPSVSHPAILLEIGGKRILIDPGADGNPTRTKRYLDEYDISNLDAIFISHYHGDHSGLIKKILQSGQFKGPIVFHSATAEIMKVYYNDFGQYSDQFVPLEYGVNKSLFGSIWVTLYNAGHVIGSSIFSIKHKDKHILVSGDLGADFLPLVKSPDNSPGPIPVDLFISDAKQIGKPKIIDTKENPLGDIIYHKVKDCFLFDEGNILIYVPLVQVPVLLYCLNYIFESEKFKTIHDKIDNVFLDPQDKLIRLLEVFDKFSYLFDETDKEFVRHDKDPFRFDKLKVELPVENNLQRSIIITPNRNVFTRFFEKFKRSEDNDVLLLNNNIHYALKDSSKPIDRFCNIQIKRMPTLHYHPDVEELTDLFNRIDETASVKKFLLYHYKDTGLIEKIAPDLQQNVSKKVELVHHLSYKGITI